MDNLVIDDSLKKGKEELLLDPGKETVRCGKKVSALVFNDLMYKQEDGSFVKASDLLKQKVLSISNISISMVQTEATITWTGAEAGTIIVDDEAPKAPSGVREHKQTYTVGHHKVGIKADADSVTAYIGLEIRDDGLKTPEQVAQIVANATAGLKTPEQVQAEVATAVEASLEVTQGYLDLNVVNMERHELELKVDIAKSPKAKGFNYIKNDGTKEYKALGMDQSVIKLDYQLYRAIEVLAGNNKVIDIMKLNLAHISIPDNKNSNSLLTEVLNASSADMLNGLNYIINRAIPSFLLIVASKAITVVVRKDDENGNIQKQGDSEGCGSVHYWMHVVDPQETNRLHINIKNSGEDTRIYAIVQYELD